MSPGNLKNEIPRWWSTRRLRYNKGLFVSLVIAIALYFIFGHEMTEGFEVSTHAIINKLVYGLIFIVIMNIVYIFGAMIDTRLNWGGMENVSKLIWNIVYWISVAIPFVMPVLILADRYDLYSPLGL